MAVWSVCGFGRGQSGRHTADTFVDRLSGRYTAGMLVIAAIVVALRRAMGDPIDCWTPAHMTEQQAKHAGQTCWMKQSYYTLPDDAPIPKPDSVVHDKRPAIYLWIPTILLVQACLFLTPNIVWWLGNLKPGITATFVHGVGEEYAAARCGEEQREVVQTAAGVMSHHLRDNARSAARGYSSIQRLLWLLYGHTLSALYLLVKLFYVINVIGQLLGVSMLLGWHPFPTIREAGFPISHWLPEEVLCDVKIRQLGNQHLFTFQCKLPINMFHENLYIIMWWWLLFVTLAAIASFIYWIIRIVFRPGYAWFVRRYLVATGRISGDGSDNFNVSTFCNAYLHGDGFLCFSLLQENAGDALTAKVVAAVFDIYLRYRQEETHRPGHQEERELLRVTSTSLPDDI